VDESESQTSSTNATVPPPTIIIQLSGEMANNFAFFMQGYAVFLYLKEKHNITARIVLRHQDSRNGSKWRHTAKTIHQCLPTFRNYSFTEGHQLAPEPQQLIQQSKELLSQGVDFRAISGLGGISHNDTSFKQSLDKFMEYYAQHASPWSNTTTDIYRPAIYAKKMAAFHNYYLNQYYSEFREVLQWDSSCCVQVPDPDESVFVSI